MYDGKTAQGVCNQCYSRDRLKRKLEKEVVVEQNQGGRPQKPFGELSSFTKRIRTQQGIEALSSVEGGSLVPLLQAITAKVGQDLERENEEEPLHEYNIAFFARTYLHQLPEISRPAAALTQGMLLKDAARLTGVSMSSISWARRELEVGNLYKNPDPVVPHPANEAKEDERVWFKEFAMSEAPVYSGSIATRRLRQNSVADFYIDYSVAVAKTTFVKRSLSCVSGWLQEMSLRPSTFDRYR